MPPLRYGERMSKHNKRRCKRGRPEEPLKIEIEFIEDEGSERWNQIFKVLENFAFGSPEVADREPTDRDYEQLTLF